MGRKEKLELLVEGGKAAPGAASAPKLSAYKLNINEIFKEINQKTADYKGMQVPVVIEIDTETKEYSIIIGTPPVSSLIKKELGIEKAAVPKEEGTKEESEEKKEEEEEEKEKTILGDLKMEQCVKIAKMKMTALLAKNLKSAVKQVVGTASSMPITIESKPTKEVLKEIDEGKYDSLLV